jgi:phage FluMu gp28-like protein
LFSTLMILWKEYWWHGISISLPVHFVCIVTNDQAVKDVNWSIMLYLRLVACPFVNAKVYQLEVFFFFHKFLQLNNAVISSFGINELCSLRSARTQYYGKNWVMIVKLMKSWYHEWTICTLVHMHPILKIPKNAISKFQKKLK